MASQSGDVLSGFAFRCSMYLAQSKRTTSPGVPSARPRTSHVASRTWNTCWYPDIALRVVTDHISPLTISTASVRVSCSQLVLTPLPHSVPTESENQTRVNKNLPMYYPYHVIGSRKTTEPQSQRHLLLVVRTRPKALGYKSTGISKGRLEEGAHNGVLAL
jgi:hypothetical protein